ncbi:hypothetical protein GGU11DRAFT_876177 [Lentinula aff. detonsa]|nr:hypothetical protein GGU11DRAFT_876177 [Lentinula aff. detonsa]
MCRIAFTNSMIQLDWSARWSWGCEDRRIRRERERERNALKNYCKKDCGVDEFGRLEQAKELEDSFEELQWSTAYPMERQTDICKVAKEQDSESPSLVVVKNKLFKFSYCTKAFRNPFGIGIERPNRKILSICVRNDTTGERKFNQDPTGFDDTRLTIIQAGGPFFKLWIKMLLDNVDHGLIIFINVNDCIFWVKLRAIVASPSSTIHTVLGKDWQQQRRRKQGDANDNQRPISDQKRKECVKSMAAVATPRASFSERCCTFVAGDIPASASTTGADRKHDIDVGVPPRLVDVGTGVEPWDSACFSLLKMVVLLD